MCICMYVFVFVFLRKSSPSASKKPQIQISRYTNSNQKFEKKCTMMKKKNGMRLHDICMWEKRWHKKPCSLTYKHNKQPYGEISFMVHNACEKGALFQNQGTVENGIIFPSSDGLDWLDFNHTGVSGTYAGMPTPPLPRSNHRATMKTGTIQQIMLIYFFFFCMTNLYLNAMLRHLAWYVQVMSVYAHFMAYV